MLSNENPNSLNEADLLAIQRDTLRKARSLGTALVNFEHNENPMREREAVNPNQGIKIRVLRPFRYLPVDQDCKDHNSLVSSVGHPELFSHWWGE